MTTPKIVVIAHNIRSTHNVGSFFRTCDGFGVQHLFLTGYTPFPSFEGDTRLPHIAQKLTTQIHKTAIGAEQSLPFSHFDTLQEAASKLRADGYEIWALEQSAKSIMLPRLGSALNPLPEKIALLLGTEVTGLSDSELAECSQIIEIPMHGKKESFNVSVALGIALYGIRHGS